MPIRTLAVALALLSSACGSTALVDGQLPAAAEGQAESTAAAEQGLTVQPSETAAASQDNSSASSDFGSVTAPSGQSSGTASTRSGQPAGTNNPTSDGQGDDSSQAPPQTSSGAPSSSGGAGVYGPGVTDDEIVIGIAIADDASQAQNATLLGASNITTGDTERYYDIMAEYLNERGGIAGRTLRYSKWRYSTAQGENTSQLEQSACAHWTQDDPAIIAAATGLESENFLGCAKDAGMATWASGLTFAGPQTLAKFPTLALISAVEVGRQGRILAEGLEDQDYFDDGYKLGVVAYDLPSWRRAVNESLEPALAKNGREIHEKAFLRPLDSTSQLGDLTAQIQSTVLRFKSEGVTHVAFMDHKGVITLVFTRSAENQAYRPRYGLTSQAGGTVIANSGVPEGQFERAVGVGWMPALDVPANEAPENPAAEECLARFAEQGQEPANANNKAVMLSVCENVFFAKAALEGGLPDVTAASFQRGMESLGAFQSLNSFSNYWSPQRHDGASHYRHMAYDPPCNCFHYTSELIADLP